MRTRSLLVLVLALAVTAACTAPATPTAPGGAPTPPSQADEGGEIRRTDWRNVTVQRLTFCGETDSAVRFRNGSNGFDIPCRMLPGGARPVYGEFLVEEPANAPLREDALVLVELGNSGAARQQALVPIQIGADGQTLAAWPVIKGDPSSAAGDRVITFTSYRIQGETVVATVRRLDGGTETRRYRQAGAYGPWERF